MIHNGDALSVLRTLPDGSVNCCITSPPYWGLRDYGTGQWDGGDAECSHRVGGQVQDNKAKGAIVAGVRPGVDASVCLDCGARRVDQQIGLEKSPEEYTAKLVEIFAQVRRVLRDDGTLWLNLGDSYNNAPGQRKQGVERNDLAGWKQQTNAGCLTIGSRHVANLKPKDLVGIPWRVAFALQADGWYLRSDIIWAKPAPMPESVTDRPTRSHEYIFLLSKQERYYYDFEAIKEPAVANHGSGNGYKRESRLSYADDNGARGSDEPWKPRSKRDSFKREGSKREQAIPGQSMGTHRPNRPEDDWDTTTRNKRDVWLINSEPFPEAHFATFPPKLILPCVLAGCPEGGTVLDPFSGAGTALLVAKENGRKFIGIELNPEYVAMAEKRMSQEVLFG